MSLVKRVLGKRGSEVVQNILVLGAMGAIAIAVMLLLNTSIDNATDVTTTDLQDNIQAAVGIDSIP